MTITLSGKAIVIVVVTFIVVVATIFNKSISRLYSQQDLHLHDMHWDFHHGAFFVIHAYLPKRLLIPPCEYNHFADQSKMIGKSSFHCFTLTVTSKEGISTLQY